MLPPVEKLFGWYDVTHSLLLKWSDPLFLPQEMIETIREIVVLILHTHDGTRVALHCVWHGTAKVLYSFTAFFYFSAKLNARKWTLFRNFINTAFQMDHSTFSKRVMSLLNIQVVVSLIPRLQSDFSSCRLRVVDRWLVQKDTRKTSMTSSL